MKKIGKSLVDLAFLLLKMYMLSVFGIRGDANTLRLEKNRAGRAAGRC